MKLLVIAAGIPFLIILLLLGAGVWLWNREHRLRTSAEQRQEAAELALKNQIVEAQVSSGQLQTSVNGLLTENAQLRAAYDQAKKAAPDARPVSASKLSTGPLRTPDRPAGAPAPCEGCMLNWGDALSVDVNVLELRTQKQNTVVVGTAAIYRDTPPPRTQLAGGPFQSSLTRSSELEVRPEPRWGALALGGCSGAGCGPGVGVLLPPARFLGVRVEGFAGALALPSGPLAVGGVGVRW